MTQAPKPDQTSTSGLLVTGDLRVNALFPESALQELARILPPLSGALDDLLDATGQLKTGPNGLERAAKICLEAIEAHAQLRERMLVSELQIQQLRTLPRFAVIVRFADGAELEQDPEGYLVRWSDVEAILNRVPQ